MKMNKTKRFHYALYLFLIAAACLVVPGALPGASTTTTLKAIGSAAATASGDFICSTAGLNRPHRFYIEVPSGLANLYVDLYDADIGAVANYTDWEVSTPFNTSCVYTLNRPDGTLEFTATYNNTQTAADSNWINFRTVTSPAAGHWELVVDMSSTGSGGGNDTNGFGIRAHDGTPGAGGTELPIYAESFIPLGYIGAEGTRGTTTFYPYITSGCTVDWNDFDGDNGANNYCRLSYESRLSTLGPTNYFGSTNDNWLNTPLTGFRTDPLNADMGIWTATARYTTLNGSTANFGVFWAGNWLAANGTPSAQPQANSFRVYLPTDSGGAPVKPYLTQKIVFVSGANPPANGTTTYIRVIIDFVNPTARTVTFSASNLVTANVPVTRVAYRGSAYAGVSQGSITVQPAAGGTGNVTWNPGTVAAGATATLYYEVGVTPTANGQRTPATGVPTASPPGATDGTWARYVDETGNTTQARATYIFGPLCELAVTSGTNIPTWVAVSCFEASSEDGGSTVEWRTDGEFGAAGFNLWRQDPVSKEFLQVNREFLPVLPGSPQGGVYRLADPGAPIGEPVTYRLEEIDVHGHSLSYGPFTVNFATHSWQRETEPQPEKKGRAETSNVQGFQRIRRERSANELERSQKGLLDRTARTASASPDPQPNRERLRITVRERGLYYLSAAQIAAGLGTSAPQVESYIRRHYLAMMSQGKMIAWLAAADNAGLFFYNEGVETLYSDQNVFWLEPGPGQSIETIAAGNGGAADPSQYFSETLHFEENKYATAALFNDANDDIWLWDYVEGGGAAKSFAMNVPAPMASGPATLVVRFKGATDIADTDDHHARVLLNGAEIGGTLWNGTDAQTLELAFNASQLVDGTNTIAIRGDLDLGAAYSLFYVESFDLTYPRQYRAVNNALLCRGDGNPLLSVSGFTDAPVLIFDVTAPDRPVILSGASPDVSGRVNFVPRAAENRYLLTSPGAALRPLAIAGFTLAHLDEPGHSAEYIVIAPEALRETAQKLADFRKGTGLSTMVVTLEEIYESFNFGLASPWVIRDFLASAYLNPNGKPVRYAVLVGKGTSDYKDYLGIGDNLCPVIMVSTAFGLCSADKEFGDVTGSDGLPEIAVGRLPVISSAELQALIDKIRGYENAQGAWTSRALMIADNDDDGGEFAAGSDYLSRLFDGYQTQFIHLASSAEAGQVHERVINALNAGAALVNYVGHGGLKQLAQESILNYNEVRFLQNGSQLPLMVMLTCATGRFDIAGITSLTEQLLLFPGGGIAGALAPAASAMHVDSMRLGEEFLKAAYRSREASAGLALVAAMRNYLLAGGNPDLLNIYNWLGDPALPFK